ncbi:MAG TPA: DNA topoisomerase VI subunit B [Candidatus Aenigmarchaeota archaeon]|nr:DNA topoisomerase VI subunit B [Candidatus Aenigmarchaeota archaeon]
MAKYREVAISEFFEKNKHLLGFDNPVKALLTVVKEGVDNALDACEEANILPNIFVRIKNLGEDIYEIIIEDNGPGIEKKYVKEVFGRLLFGSKFKSLGEEGIQSRGQQGIGISASILYAQLTTGEPAEIESKVKDGLHYSCKLYIDTTRNTPIIEDEKILESTKKHGTKIVLKLRGSYRKNKGVEDYIKYTSIANPHAEIIYIDPEGKKHIFKRAIDKLPKKPKSIAPHPHGIELGTLIKMLARTKSKNLYNFLRNDFSKVGDSAAREILFSHYSKLAKLKPTTKPTEVTKTQAEKLLRAMQTAKLQRPPTDCLSPIGEENIIKGLSKEYKANFVTACTRPVAVYRAIPFQVEVGLLYSEELPEDNTINLIRYANKVPMIYQQSECAIYKAVVATQWRRYGLNQSKGSLPIGPIVLTVHIASVWVPFISEGKQAIANYPEIIREIKLALLDVGRKLKRYISAQQRRYAKEKRVKIFEKYSVEIARALADLTEEDKEKIIDLLKKIIERERL